MAYGEPGAASFAISAAIAAIAGWPATSRRRMAGRRRSGSANRGVFMVRTTVAEGTAPPVSAQGACSCRTVPYRGEKPGRPSGPPRTTYLQVLPPVKSGLSGAARGGDGGDADRRGLAEPQLALDVVGGAEADQPRDLFTLIEEDEGGQAVDVVAAGGGGGAVGVHLGHDARG